MKKIIILALTLLMIFSCIVPSFADTTAEEAEILEAAKKGMVVANLFLNQQMFYDVYQSVDMENEDSEIYSFMQKLLKYNGSKGIVFTTYTPYEGEMVSDPTLDYFNDLQSLYGKTGELINSLEDAHRLADTYLTAYNLRIDDENTVEIVYGKYKKYNPKFRTINDDFYLCLETGNMSMDVSEIYFDEFEVIKVNENKATINAPQLIMDKRLDLTIELVKINGQWKVCGGTTFSYEHGLFFHNNPFPPNTGEDFSLATHTVIIAATLSIMLLITRKRYHKA